jgi:hypothetical protein
MASAHAFAAQTDPGPAQVHAFTLSAVNPAMTATRAALTSCDRRMTNPLTTLPHSLDTAKANLAVSDEIFELSEGNRMRGDR